MFAGNRTSAREVAGQQGFVARILSQRRARLIGRALPIIALSRIFPGRSERKLIVMVANMLSDVTGHPRLIAAAPAIVREFPQVRFVLVGDGERRKEFERQVAELALERNFLFLGRRRDVPEILASCDIAVLPSTAEGMPNAVLEYMAAGLATVASNVGGVADSLT